MATHTELKLEPAILTIFGITGDLAHRKLLPALYHLAENDLLPPTLQIIGTTRQNIKAVDVIQKINETVEKSGETTNQKTLNWLTKSLSIVSMDITDPKDYAKLKLRLNNIEDELGQCLHRLFYLAIPSTVFGPVIDRLGKADLNTGCQHGVTKSRLLIEKPFGYDLVSAEELVETLKQSFKEEDIYRIDHYLAKETVQNIMTLRFQNPLFKSVWNGQHISHILITAAESIGIEGRTNFYEQTGALRDIIQSHLLQVLALVTMEEPKNVSAEAIHTSRQLVLEQIKPPKPNEMHQSTVRAQYESYKAEVENPDSTSETFAAIKFTIENETWKNTPIFIRTGKNLAQKTTEITLTFSDENKPDYANYLTIRIQPNEGIVMDLRIKRPGYTDEIEHVQMDFCYTNTIDASHPDAYERVLVDTLRGDKTLFATSDAVIASWQIIQPILDAWEQNRVPLVSYKNGSWGPADSNVLLEKSDAHWMTAQLNICTPRLPRAS